MGTDLHSTLRSLCFNTDWKYAVFWKLKHRARMVLTWEDAYYVNFEQQNPSANKCLRGPLENLYDGRYSHDPLGLAVAKMSYHVYALGEGIIGHVAVTGKHKWIIADKHTNYVSSFGLSDGWQSQFSAGIRTVVVVAVVPYGVVQLGSLNIVAEDVSLVNHIKSIFSPLQEPSIEHVTHPAQYNTKSSLYMNTAVETVSKYGGVRVSKPVNIGSAKLLQSRSDISYLEPQNQAGMNFVIDNLCGGKTAWKGRSQGSELNMIPHLDNSIKDNIHLSGVKPPTQKFEADLVNLSADLLDSTVFDGHESDGINVYVSRTSNMPESSGVNLKNDFGEKLECRAESNHLDTPKTILKFSAGFELYEALGPAFSKGYSYFNCEEEKIESRNIIEMPEEINTSQMTFETCSENLLDAIVGNACYSGSSFVNCEKSLCQSAESLLTTEKMPDPPFEAKYTIHSAGNSINQQSVIQDDTQNCASSTGACGATSSQGFSSACPRPCSEQLDRQSEPAKSNKKRAKPGENSRPRPRDRQLIQDRIKELRELVPNGAKCSIDSLLERTIKHMLFLESITKHADKLNKCADTKKGNDTSNYEKGSSWAVEVGGHLKVSSIVVENLNRNGQMLVEMICEECSHFLEIAEAIRSLGLTILKGFTEVHGEKKWICFIVEGQNNKVMHRMDILWPLVQIFQPRT